MGLGMAYLGGQFSSVLVDVSLLTRSCKMMTGTFPFPHDTTPMVLMYKIITGMLPDLSEVEQFRNAPQLVSLARRCWSPSPSARPTMVECLDALQQ